MTFETLIVETLGAVSVIRLNRPDALNALNSTLLSELGLALDAISADDATGCVVLTGSARMRCPTFAAATSPALARNSIVIAGM